MVFAINVKKNKYCCHDCKKEIEFEGEEIKNGVSLVYDDKEKKLTVFKCKECFDKDPSLRNYRECEVYSRIVGYLRPVQQWNAGKREEFRERKTFRI